MKICTITCHDVYNHGASLQAYALMRYLKELGNDVEIIDYKPEYLSKHYKLFTIDNPKWEKNIVYKVIYLSLKIPYKLPGIRRKRAFDRFKNMYLRLTEEIYSTNEELKERLPNADIYICGSDQIWNSLHQNGRDLAFYLDFVPEYKIKASYAASIATDTISTEYQPMVKKQVSKLDRVAVRESSAVRILNEIGVNKVVEVVDPVFLLDKSSWDELAKERFEEKYLLVYDFDNNPLIKKICKELSIKKKLKIYSISHYRMGYEDKSFRYSGPDTFISLVKNAECVVSNSFHAIVFAIIYKRQVVVANRMEAINTRMQDLLKSLGIENRLITNITEISRVVNEDIDYKRIEEKLDNKINISKKYLREVIEFEK